MTRLKLASVRDVLALDDDDLEWWLAYDQYRQQAVEAIVESLAHPKNGKESQLTPEAYAVLMLAKL